MRKKTVVVLIVFIVISSALVITGAAVQKVKDLGFARNHEAINISGDDAFITANGVRGGTGAQDNPYVIENWRIESTTHTAVTINDTSAFVVIRNCSIWSNNYRGAADGISISRARNVLIENVTLANLRVGVNIGGSVTANSEDIAVRTSAMTACSLGLLAQNATGLIVENAVMNDMALAGVIVENSSHVQMRDIRLSDFGLYLGHYTFGDYMYINPGYSLVAHFPQTGIGFGDARNCTIWGSDLSGGGHYVVRSGLLALRCDNITISNNSMRFTEGLYTDVSSCTQVTFSNNSGYSGLQVSGSADCLVADNSISYAHSGYADISVSRTHGAAILRNSLTHSYAGINGFYMNDSMVRYNTVTSGAYGGLGLTGTNLTISRNIVTDTSYPIYVSGAEIAFEDNSMRSNWVADSYNHAARFHECAGLEIKNNSFIDNSGGIEVYECSQSIMMNNNMTDSISLYNVENATISGNTMYNVSVNPENIPEAFLGLSNISWDQGYPKGGNYWTGYPGADVKSGSNQNQPGPDGIGDTPYLVFGSEYDNYPLINASSVEDNSPPITVRTLAGESGHNGWWRSEVNISLSGFDVRSEVSDTSYRVDAGSWSTFSTNVTISSDGIHSFEYYSVDGAGNRESTWNTVIKIDTQKPYSTFAHFTNHSYSNVKTIAIEFGFEDNTSGVAEFSVDQFYSRGTTLRPAIEAGLKNGTLTFYLDAVDKAGNWNQRVVIVHDSLNENKQLLSGGGPYGIWYLVGILTDLGVLAYLVHLRADEVLGPSRPPPRNLRPGEIDKEELVDGYPKYLKRV